MDATQARARFAEHRRAVLASVRPDGAPHLVPITFALAGPDLVVTAVDDKPKRHDHLQRLRNLDHEPRVSLLADHYADTWNELWWVRADGRARVEPPGSADWRDGIAALAARYPAYARRTPTGPVIAVDVARWVGWAAHP